MNQARVFFAHSSCDKPQVTRHIEQIHAALQQLDAAWSCQDLSAHLPQSPHWKAIAQPLIVSAQVVVCFVGEKTHQSEPVAWEITTAIAAGRPVLTISLADDVPVPTFVPGGATACKPFSAQAVAADILALVAAATAFTRPSDTASLLGQYTAMVQSWEALINRRQSVNQLYLTGVVGLTAAAGSLLALAKDWSGPQVPSGCFLLGCLGLLLCWNWWRTILSYGTLSTAKSKVVLALESQLPFDLFGNEWAVLQKDRYISTTQLDQQTIRACMLLFGGGTLAAALVLANAWFNR